MYLIWLFYAYLYFGVLFAPVFVFNGAGVIDPDVRKTSFWFKLMIIPGSILLWPLLLLKWLKTRRNEP